MPKVLVEFNSIEEAVAALGGTAQVPVAAAPQQYAPAPVPVNQAPAPMPAQAAPQYAPPAAPAPVQQLTAADVTAAVQAYAKAHGPANAKAILSQYNVSAVAQLQPQQYAAVIAAFKVG